MLLKKADDKSKRLTLLRDLQKSDRLDPRQKEWLSNQLAALERGMEGERESAYYLDQHFKDGENHVVLHDLRFVVDGDVAQIDHLIINRLIGFYLIETKNWGGNVEINARGEFTMKYGSRRFGVESPIEQSHRHERVLGKLLERLEISTRTGTEMGFYHVVMYHPRAIIDRPRLSDFDTRNVIKADQFPTWHSEFVDKKLGFGTVLRGIANMRSLETIKEWGEKLMRQHRPEDPLVLPDFMRPREVEAGIVRATDASPGVAAESKNGGKGPLVCHHCNAKISFAEGRFCWNNEARFKGGQYCRAHQALF